MKLIQVAPSLFINPDNIEHIRKTSDGIDYSITMVSGKTIVLTPKEFEYLEESVKMNRYYGQS